MATEIDERVIELAKREMDKRGWTQRQLATEIGLTDSEISLLLNRKRPWSLNLIVKFSQVAGIEIPI